MSITEITVCTLAGIILLVVLPYMISTLVLFRKFFGRHDRRRTPEELEKDSAYFEPFRAEYADGRRFLLETEKTVVSVDVTEKKTLITLKAYYYRNKGNKTAILMHGFGTEPELCLGIWGKFLWEEGFSLLVPFQRAHLESGGKYITLGVNEGDDTVAWAEEMHRLRPGDEILAMGISMGAASVLFASDRLGAYGVRALIADCAFDSPRDQLVRVCRRMHIPSVFLIPNSILTAKLLSGADFGRRCSDSLRKSGLPVFFIHGTEDTTAIFKDSEPVFAAAPEGSELYPVEGAEHSVALPYGGDAARERVKSFIKKYFRD